MPVDKPKQGETKEHYMKYCMGALKDEYSDVKQRYAVCMNNFLDKYSNSIGKYWYKSKNDISKFAEAQQNISLNFATIGPRGGVNPSKKAPNSDTKNPDPKRGSDKNKPGAAATGRGVEVPASVLETLQNKADEWNEKYKETRGYGANVGALKTVYQRGVGAFQTSRSPLVKSSQQWAMARVNSFLLLLKDGRPQNPKYVTDNDLLPEKHPRGKK